MIYGFCKIHFKTNPRFTDSNKNRTAKTVLFLFDYKELFYPHFDAPQLRHFKHPS